MRPLQIDWDQDTALPVSLQDVKAQLRVLGDQFDALLHDIHIPAAVQWAEGEMHRSILAKTHYWVLDDFPMNGEGIWLPRGKTQSVSSIVYSYNNSTLTLRGPTSGSPAGTDYREDLRGDDGGVIYPAYNSSWPGVDIQTPTPVLITFTAGWTVVPADIKRALIMYCADALDITGASDFTQYTNLSAKDMLISGYRLRRW